MFKMMVVDDEPLTREYLRKNVPLLSSRWEVSSEAMDGKEALDLIKESNVDLIVTDIKMPVMDGLELCREVSKEYPKIKIVILSGYDEFEFARKAIKYGVKDYILKPIVREELKSILDNMALTIEEGRYKEAAYKAMVNLSEYSKRQIVKDFFRAAILDSSIEIKALYPAMFNLKMSIIESEGAVLVLSLDEYSVILKNLQINEIPIYKFMLDQAAEEIAEKLGCGPICLDNEGDTLVLITGSNQDEICKRSFDMYNSVASNIWSTLGITVSGGLGFPVSDELQLNISYKAAVKVLDYGVLSCENSLYEYKNHDMYSKQVSDLDKLIAPIISGVFEGRLDSLTLSIAGYIDSIKDLNSYELLKYGLYLIRRIRSMDSRFSGEMKESALSLLKDSIKCKKDTITRDKAITLFTCIASNASDSGIKTAMYEEKDIVDRAKEYICSHFAEPISLALIAEKIGVSSGYLSSIFHKNAGEPYIKFLTKVRMEQAKRLLKSCPAQKIYNISEAVGYVSVKHFSYIFKKFTGVSPGEYQERG